VSGRPVAFLRRALALDGLVYAGVHGFEREVGGTVVVDPRVEPWTAALAELADEAEARFPGARVERKGRVAVAFHWREAPGLGAELARWAEQAIASRGLHRRPGRMVVEALPPAPVDKGTTVADLAAGARYAAFAGDDAGDVVAFGALRALVASGALAGAATIGVRSVESPPGVLGADVVVDGPAGLAALFGALADAVTRRARGGP